MISFYGMEPAYWIATLAHHKGQFIVRSERPFGSNDRSFLSTEEPILNSQRKQHHD
jgi:hypothetical protein